MDDSGNKSAGKKLSFSFLGGLGDALSKANKRESLRYSEKNAAERAIADLEQQRQAQPALPQQKKTTAAALLLDAASHGKKDKKKKQGPKTVVTKFKRAAFKTMIINHMQHCHEGDEELHPADELMIENALMQCPVFESCSQDFVTYISESSHSHRFVQGNVIATQGGAGSSMIVVLQGAVDVLIDEEKVASLGSGQHMGETQLLGLESVWDASLVVQGTCVICEVTRECFQSACEAHSCERRFFDAVYQRNKDCLSEGTLIKTCVVFDGLSDTTMCDVDAHLARRLYFPGEHLTEEGTPGDELFILIRGNARVEIAGRLVRLEKRNSGADLEMDQADAGAPGSDVSRDPVCFGELGLLGMQDLRNATVSAETVCHVRVLYRNIFLKILEKQGESMHQASLTKMLDARYASQEHAAPQSQVLRDVKIFQQVGCSNEFLDFLAEHLEDRIFLTNQKIIDENNASDRCMYLVNRGSARVLKNGCEVAVLRDGAVVGEIIVLGLASKRTATVVAAETCYMHVLHQSVVVRGLELFPLERSKLLMMAHSSHDTSGQDTFKAFSPLASMDPQESMLGALKNSPLLQHVSTEFIEELGHVAHSRIYMPGDLIIEQGMRGDSMFIMVSGSASVFVADATSTSNKTGFDEPVESMMNSDSAQLAIKKYGKSSLSKVGSLTVGSVGGEIAMLGISQTRSATIEAVSICSMWEISSDDAMPILDRYRDAQQHFERVIIEHLERTVPTRISSLPLFHNFDRKFRTLLGIYCERRAYFPQNQIVREGQRGEHLFVMNVGRARLDKKGVTVKMYAPGSHFGSTVMLGMTKVYLGTLVALQTCHVLLCSKNSYHAAFEQYPQPAASKELKASEVRHTEALREAVVRTATRKLIWKRYQNLMKQGPLFSILLDSQGSDPEVLERYIQAWHQRAMYQRQKRDQEQREDQQRQMILEKYLQKRADAQEHALALRHTLHGFAPPIDGKRSPLARRRLVAHGGRGGDVVKLPQVVQDLDKDKLATYLESWPSPRVSPHYKLRVFGVLNEATESRTKAQTLLPLLRIDSRGRGSDALRVTHDGFRRRRWDDEGKNAAHRTYYESNDEFSRGPSDDDSNRETPMSQCETPHLNPGRLHANSIDVLD